MGGSEGETSARDLEMMRRNEDASSGRDLGWGGALRVRFQGGAYTWSVALKVRSISPAALGAARGD